MESSFAIKNRWVLFFIFFGVAGLISILFIFSELDKTAAVAGYALGFLSIGLHYIMSAFSMRLENDAFFSLYMPASLLRLLVVISIYIAVIIMGNFDQIGFTVSFLISYIYHSVINIFLLNKRTNNRQG